MHYQDKVLINALLCILGNFKFNHEYNNNIIRQFKEEW